jgi:uncharacterized phiE125 gp8 family phage protein
MAPHSIRRKVAIMSLVPLGGPASEPVSLAELKVHLRVYGTSEDLFISSLITAARVHLELALSCAFITQTWSWFLDDWPRRQRLELPMGPVQGVAAIRVLTVGDTVVTMPPASYLLTGTASPPRLSLKERRTWSTAAPQPAYAANGIEIEFIAGFGNTPLDVPGPIRQALLLLVAHWYELRTPIEVGGTNVDLPPAVATLLAPYRKVRL